MTIVPMSRQCERVLNYMRDFGTITQLDAIKELGVMRLASRINDLKKLGFNIGKSMKTDKNRYGESVSYAEYFIKEN